MVKDIKIADFDYPLPEASIASHPLAERDQCKLLVRRPDGSLEEHIFADLPGLLPPDSMLIYNNTRVINARLRFRKTNPDGTQGALIEIFCLEPHYPRDYAQNFAATDQCSWQCFVGNSKRWKSGPLTLHATLPDGRIVTLEATRSGRDDTGTSTVVFSWQPDCGITFSEIIAATGEIPIPPYLNRPSQASDQSDYQTVYSHIEGSVAAPTAGLHFTPEVLADIDALGIPRRELTLHVGAGTFQPVKSDNIGSHPMHAEFFAVPRALIAELATTNRRSIAVGTTSVRTLESLYHAGCALAAGRWTGELPQWAPYADLAADAKGGGVPQLSLARAMEAILSHLDAIGSDTFIGSTRIIIAPGYRYRVVQGMVTNFHQPRSTLLLLVSAFTGGDWRPMYDYALAHSFRFLSYGDAQLLL